MMEHPRGIEPRSEEWKSSVLPLNYGCEDKTRVYPIAIIDDGASTGNRTPIRRVEVFGSAIELRMRGQDSCLSYCDNNCVAVRVFELSRPFSFVFVCCDGLKIVCLNLAERAGLEPACDSHRDGLASRYLAIRNTSPKKK